MRELSTKTFITAIDRCVAQHVNFILFAGDIFNTSLPSMDTLKVVTKKLKELADLQIPVYTIAGSHDFSPSGKTMLDILEQAGLLKNVCTGTVDPETRQLHLSFTVDPKTGAKMTGILGRKGQLDRAYYENLFLQNLEQEPGYKIFLFHTSVTELKPKHLEHVESYPASFLPKGFDYYAGGHLHHPARIDLPEYGPLTYPGALFPNSFSELEKYGHGGYYLVTVEEHVGEYPKEQLATANGPKFLQTIEWKPVKVYEHHSLTYDCKHQPPEVVALSILEHFNALPLQDSVVTIRIRGTLERGKTSDINIQAIADQLRQRGAHIVLKNTADLNTAEFEEIKISTANPDTVEEELIKEHLQQVKVFAPEAELQLTKSLLTHLNTAKKEGETINDFQDRVQGDIDKLFPQG